MNASGVRFTAHPLLTLKTRLVTPTIINHQSSLIIEVDHHGRIETLGLVFCQVKSVLRHAPSAHYSTRASTAHAGSTNNRQPRDVTRLISSCASLSLSGVRCATTPRVASACYVLLITFYSLLFYYLLAPACYFLNCLLLTVLFTSARA